MVASAHKSLSKPKRCPAPFSYRGLKIDLPTVIRTLDTARSIGDVLYRALRTGVDFEEPTARVLRECIIDELDHVLNTLHGLPGDES